MKQLKDYLHLYLGCECRIGDSPDPHHVLMVNETGLSICTGTNVKGIPIWYKTAHAKLVLRPLSDMTEEEFEVFKSYCENDFSKMVIIESMSKDESYTRLCHQAEAQRYLLSRSFDLFNLIPEGLAIDKTTLNQKP